MPDARAEQPPARNNSSSLRRALEVLLYLGGDGPGGPDSPGGADARGSTLAELAEALELNKSTLLRLLAPLCELRLVEQRGGRYRLGSRTAQLGQVYLERLDLREVAHDVLAGLMSDTGETAHLVIADLPEVIYVDKVEAPRPVRMFSRIGRRQPAYCTAVGKAILANASATSVAGVIAGGLPARTPNTHTSAAALRADLAVIRRRGYAVDELENEADIRCVAAPVFDHAGAVDCAVSVSGPANRVTRERIPELGGLVGAAAEVISARLGARL